MAMGLGFLCGPRPFKFHSVETRGDLGENRYTQTYRVQYTLDGNTWIWYKNGVIFNGNTNNINGVNNTFEPFIARAARIWPLTSVNGRSLRAEMYISELLYDAQPPKRLTTIKAIQSGFNVVLPNMYEPLYGNDCFTINFRTNNINKAWCSASSSLNQAVIISAPIHVRWHQIIIQGKPKSTERVNSVSIKYTVDGILWSNYSDNAELLASFDENTLFGIKLVPFVALAVKIIPKTYETSICMRFEAYCTKI